MSSKHRIILLVTLLAFALGVLSYKKIPDSAAFIGAIQAIILGITFAAIWWYTEETQKIREATLQQNQIMGDQLRVMQETATFQNQRERNLAQPIFQPAGYDSSPDEANVRFKNLGALVTNLTVEIVPKCTASISPSNAPTDEIFTVHLKQLRGIAADMHIKIFFDDQINQRGCKMFLWHREKGAREMIGTGV